MPISDGNRISGDRRPLVQPHALRTYSRTSPSRSEVQMVLSRRRMFPPSSDEIHPAIEESLRLIRAKRRGIEPRKDQILVF
jgi:hypothetical protein